MPRTFLPEQNKYLFIDGGHLRECFALGLREWMGEVLPTDINFETLISRTRALKSFYYDGQEEGRLPDEYFANIRSVSGSHVRFGTLKGKSNKKREPRQKEVDILLACDMMNHTIRKNMDEAVLLAGDMDFVPLVESLVEMGCFVTLMAGGQHVAQELVEAADEFHELRLKDYHAIASHELQKKYPLPYTGNAHLLPSQQGFTFIKTGTCLDRNLDLYQVEREGRDILSHIYEQDSNRIDQPLTYSFNDLSRLELFYKLQFEEIQWQQGDAA